MSLILAIDFYRKKPTIYQFNSEDHTYPDPEKVHINSVEFDSAFDLKKYVETLSNNEEKLIIGYRTQCIQYEPMTPEFITNPLHRDTLQARIGHEQIPHGRDLWTHINDLTDINNRMEQIIIYDPIQIEWGNQFKETVFDCFYGLRIRGATYSAVSMQQRNMLDTIDNKTLTVNFSTGVTISASHGVNVIGEYFDCISGYDLKRHPEDIAYHMMGMTSKFGEPNHIVFTGESIKNRPEMRDAILKHLPLLDFSIDDQLLAKRSNGVISQIGSRTRIFTLEDQSAIEMFRRIKHALEYREYINA